MTLLQTINKRSKGEDSASAINDVFSKAKDSPEMVPGMQYFLKELKSSSLASAAERKALKRDCRVAMQAVALLDFNAR
jgi:hypothetical protein